MRTGVVVRARGPLALFTAWAVHDLEELIAFPATTQRLAEDLGADWVRITGRQSAAAIGLMGTIVGAACVRGAVTSGRSRTYRRVVAGLDLHVWTHVLAPLLLRRYTAGALTAVPIMLPGALAAKRELASAGYPLTGTDRATGLAMMALAALACHGAARALVRA